MHDVHANNPSFAGPFDEAMRNLNYKYDFYMIVISSFDYIPYSFLTG